MVTETTVKVKTIFPFDDYGFYVEDFDGREFWVNCVRFEAAIASGVRPTEHLFMRLIEQGPVSELIYLEVFNPLY